MTLRVALVNNMPPATGIGRYTLSLDREFHKGLAVKSDLFWVSRFTWGRTLEGSRSSQRCALESHLKTLANYFFASKQLPRKYDIYHITSQMIGSFARYNKPSVVTFTDVLTSGRNVRLDPDLNKAGVYPRRISRDITSTTLYHYFLRRNLQEAIQESKKIICISSYVADKLIEAFRLSAKKIEVVHCGVDLASFRPRNMLDTRRRLDLPQRAKLILHVGSELPMKNVGTVIRAFSKISDKSSDFYLVRLGAPSKATLKLMSEYGIAEKVLYRSPDPDLEVPLYYNACDVLVFPSVYEGFGLPLVEAMASGCPVVASNATAIPEVLGDAGIMTSPFEFEELADQVVEVISNNELRHRLVESGVRRASKFSWANTAMQTLGIYEKVLS